MGFQIIPRLLIYISNIHILLILCDYLNCICAFMLLSKIGSSGNTSFQQLHEQSKHIQLDFFFAANDKKTVFNINSFKNSNPNKHFVFGGVCTHQSDDVRNAVANADLSFIDQINFNKSNRDLLNDHGVQQLLKFMCQNQIMVHNHEMYLFNAWTTEMVKKAQNLIIQFSQKGMLTEILEWLTQNSRHNEILIAFYMWAKTFVENNCRLQVNTVTQFAEKFRGELRNDLVRNNGAEIVKALSCLKSLLNHPEQIKTSKYCHTIVHFEKFEISLNHKMLMSLMLHSVNATNHIDRNTELITSALNNQQFSADQEKVVFFDNQYPYGENNPINLENCGLPRTANIRFYNDSNYHKNMQRLAQSWVYLYAKFCDSIILSTEQAYPFKVSFLTQAGATAILNFLSLVDSSNSFSNSLVYGYENLLFGKDKKDLSFLREVVVQHKRSFMRIA